MLLPRLVGSKGNSLVCAPLLPGNLAASALIELVSSTGQAHTGWLHPAIWKAALRKQAAPSALLTRVHIAAAARGNLAISILDREDTAGTVDAGLGRLKLWGIPRSILVPLDLNCIRTRRHFSCLVRLHNRYYTIVRSYSSIFYNILKLLERSDKKLFYQTVIFSFDLIGSLLVASLVAPDAA
jgi:hypothetical protein